MDCASADDGLFRTSFIAKGLVTFGECLTHYASLGSDALLDEMRLMLTPPMLAVPFGVSSARYYALMDALIRCAGKDPDLGDAKRAKLVGICTDICVFLRDRTPEGRREAFDTALAMALDAVRVGSAYPEIIGPIAKAGRRAPAEMPETAAAEDLQVLDFAEPPVALRRAHA